MSKKGQGKKRHLKKQVLLLVFLIIIAFLISIVVISVERPGFIPLSITPSKPKTTTIQTYFQTQLQEKTNKCAEDNPMVKEGYCTDLAYHDIAIAERDISLCEKITTSKIRAHCFRSL